MGGGTKHIRIPPSPATIILLATIVSSSLFLSQFSFVSAAANNNKNPRTPSFTKNDNFLVNCGGTKPITGPNGEPFKTDEESRSLLHASDNHLITDPSIKTVSPLYTTARVYRKEATYSFHLKDSGWHWIRLHFLPLKTDIFNLQTATFDVFTDKLTLLHSFTTKNTTQPIVKEYLINADTRQFNLRFIPQKDSAAYINAIELVSAPEKLISDSGQSLFPVDKFNGLHRYAYESVYRLNVGGSEVTAGNDTLGRKWNPDKTYIKDVKLAKSVSVQPSVIKYPETVTPLIAPRSVYSSAVEMADAGTVMQKFNVTWEFEVDKAFSYLVRFHFCDIVSKSLHDLYFNVYVNGKTAISGVDLSSINDWLASPNYQDIVVNSSTIEDKLVVQISPTNLNTGAKNAILNGLEILKMNNEVNSLDGEYGPDGRKVQKVGNNNHRQTVAAVGFAMMFGACIGLGAMVIKWHKRPTDWQRRNSFSSWLLPVHAGDTSFMSSKGASRTSMFSATGLGRRFTFEELQEATKGFESNSIIGVGGFGNVYIGTIDGGVKVAVKRGNPQSEQGINEFMTEIHMLSKLRHKHLVSLIGYCDEGEEMCLVYEFMLNGPFRDHLYGKGMENKTKLSWKQRLEICIGAARGLHYLHTGSSKGIIHRDVKTTNILLDDHFVAKMADFGLSKDGPGQAQDHVSTAVKGSFGYLDPEYFRKQQLTEKSDVYSFGVVLLEALCARPPIDPSLPREQVNLAEWAMQCKRKNKLEKMVDPALVGSIDPESMRKFVEAAEKCLSDYGVDRPTMGDVLWNLEHALQLQETGVVVVKEEEEGETITATPETEKVDEKETTEQFYNLSGR